MRLSIIVTMNRESWAAKGISNGSKTSILVWFQSLRLSIIVTVIRERWAAKGSSNSFKTPILVWFRVKKIVEFSSKRLTPPLFVEKQ